MVKQVQKNVHTSIEAVKKKDLDMSNKIFEIEQEIDVMYYECLDKLVEQAPTAEKCVVSSLLSVRHLERIADHATYMGESIKYVVTGERISPRWSLKRVYSTITLTASFLGF